MPTYINKGFDSKKIYINRKILFSLSFLKFYKNPLFAKENNLK